MRQLFTVLALSAAAMILGCRQLPSTGVPISGQAIRPDLGVDVEVTNWSGGVSVVADPRYKQPEVRSRIRRLSKDAPKDAGLRNAVLAEAIAGIENGRRVIRVRTQPAMNVAENQVAMDIEVRVARAQDVRISSSNGAVNVKGFDGALTIVNGIEGRPGGRVLVRTQAGVTSPVSISTTSGDVIYKSGPGTKGAFELLATGGTAQFEAQLGTVTRARPDPSGNRYRAILDGGENPITIRTGKGIARVEIIENAGTSGPDHWNGWIEADDEPHWMQVLTGDAQETKTPAPSPK
jgi:hypothetical protein